jgi:hypothetical protein
MLAKTQPMVAERTNKTQQTDSVCFPDMLNASNLSLDFRVELNVGYPRSERHDAGNK